MIYALDGNAGHTKEQNFEYKNITSAAYYRQIENHIKRITK